MERWQGGQRLKLPGRKGDEDRGRKITIHTERGREKFGWDERHSTRIPRGSRMIFLKGETWMIDGKRSQTSVWIGEKG